MACLNMFNTEQQGLYTSSMGPRISFSINDFPDTQQAAANKNENNYKEAPVSSDFEFSVTNNTTVTADEIFCTSKLWKTTLRDELLLDDDDDDMSPRIPKGSGWWKGRLGSKKAHTITKRGEEERNVSKKAQGQLAEIERVKSDAIDHKEQEKGGAVETLSFFIEEK